MRAQSSWFVISLSYTAPLEAVDAAMADHVKFVQACHKAGVFIAWGRKVPRTGGIILATADSLETILQVMQLDPFVKRKLTKFDVTEFAAKPAHILKGVQALLQG